MAARGGKRPGRRQYKKWAHMGSHATSAEQRGCIKEIETRERRAGRREAQENDT